MNVKYDPELDAFHVRFAAGEITESEEVAPGVILDFDSAGRILALEILDARKTLPPDAFPLAAE